MLNVTLEPQAWAGLEFGDLAALVTGAEQAGAASVTFTDPATRGAEGVWRWDPQTAAAALAGVTSSVGLVITVPTSFTDPFTAPRLAGSIDHFTAGRAGWLLDVQDDPVRRLKTRPIPQVFGPDDPAGRAAELVAAARSLWDGWHDGAFLADPARHSIIDPEKIVASDFDGDHFRLAGPSTLRRPPGGNPPVFVAVGDDGDARLAIAAGDVALVPLADLATRLPALQATDGHPTGRRRFPLAVLGSAALDGPCTGPDTVSSLAVAVAEAGLTGADLVVTVPTMPQVLAEAVSKLGAVLRGPRPAGQGLRARYGLPVLRS